MIIKKPLWNIYLIEPIFCLTSICIFFLTILLHHASTFLSYNQPHAQKVMPSWNFFELQMLDICLYTGTDIYPVSKDVHRNWTRYPCFQGNWLLPLSHYILKLFWGQSKHLYWRYYIRKSWLLGRLAWAFKVRTRSACSSLKSGGQQQTISGKKENDKHIVHSSLLYRGYKH